MEAGASDIDTIESGECLEVRSPHRLSGGTHVTLLLNEAPADMSWQKGFNDVSKRHHNPAVETAPNGGWAGSVGRCGDVGHRVHLPAWQKAS